jgi:hypothetical protein
MYINNIGSIVFALAYVHKAPSSLSSVSLARLQATQVSALSIGNCLGRICMGKRCCSDAIPLLHSSTHTDSDSCTGASSDYAKTRCRLRRVCALSFLGC